MPNRPFLWVLILWALLMGCTPQPREIAWGTDICHFCKMTVVDKQHAAQLVTSKGKVFVFDAIECQVNYLSKLPSEEAQAHAHYLVCDYAQPGTLIGVDSATFLISKAIPSPMGAFLSAFGQESTAIITQQEKGGDLYTWNELPEALK